MANTPGGLPYPVGTDKVVNGDDAIKALAERLDTAEWEVTRVENQNMTTSTWQLMGATATPVSRGGIYLAGGGNGITTKLAGRYLVHAHGSISQNATGRRGILIGTSSAAPASQVVLPAIPSGVMPLALSTVVTAAAGDSWGVFLFQDSGATLLGSNARLTMYRLP